MIVVDTNVVVRLLLHTDAWRDADRLYEAETEWTAPLLWRSEFRNVLATHMRRGLLSYEQAVAVMQEAEHLLAGADHTVPSPVVLELARDSKCTAYDCEFVALALQLEVNLVTSDRQVLRAFPGVAVAFR